MSTQEFWWELDTKREINDRLQNYKTGAGKFSEAEWAKARRLHTEKMNGGTVEPSR